MGKLIIDLPDALHREFKARCYATGKSMREVLILMVEKYLAENKQA